MKFHTVEIYLFPIFISQDREDNQIKSKTESNLLFLVFLVVSEEGKLDFAVRMICSVALWLLYAVVFNNSINTVLKNALFIDGIFLLNMFKIHP